MECRFVALCFLFAIVLPISSGQEVNGTAFDEVAKKSVVACLISNGVPKDRLFTKGDFDYKKLSRPRNKLFKPEPVVVVTPKEPHHVQAAVKCAVAFKLPVVPYSGGHHYEGKCSTNGVLVNFRKMNKILDFKKSTGVVTFEPGITLGELYVSLWEMSDGKYLYNGGSCTTVSSGQLTTGGIGYFTRLGGLALDMIISYRMVIADGSLITVNQSSHAGLFWGRYSCGPQFGIVVDFTVQALKVGPKAVLSQIDWQGRDAMFAAIKSYQQWVGKDTWPIECGPYLRLWPKRVSMVTICLLSKEETKKKFWNPIVKKLMPKGSTVKFDEMSPIETFQRVVSTSTGEGLYSLKQIKEDRIEPLGKRSANKMKSRMVMKPMSDEAIEFLVDHFMQDGKVIAPDRAILKAMGGRAKVGKPSSYPWRDALFKLPMHSSWMNDNAKNNKKHFEGMEKFDAKLEKLGVSKTSYCGYSDTTQKDWRERTWGKNLPGMKALKKKYDPKGVFNFGSDL